MIIKTKPTAPITCELGLLSFALVCFLIYELVLVLSTVRIDLSLINFSCSISFVKFPPPKPHGHRKVHAIVDSDVVLLIIVYLVFIVVAGSSVVFGISVNIVLAVVKSDSLVVVVSDTLVVVDSKSVVVELENVVESKSVVCVKNAVASGKHVSINVDIFEEVGGSLP